MFMELIRKALYTLKIFFIYLHTYIVIKELFQLNISGLDAL